MKTLFHETMEKVKVVPVAVFNDVSRAIRAAEELLQNSLPVIEITLRTVEAFACIRELSKRYSNLVVGAGSVLTPEALKKAQSEGAQFIVAPCIDGDVLECALSLGIRYIPGVATPSELNGALKNGIDIIKVFPASSFGGVAFVNSLVAPFAMYDFHVIPTGGIKESNIKEYFTCKRVIACGLSYPVEADLLEKNEYDEIGRRIRHLRQLLIPA